MIKFISTLIVATLILISSAVGQSVSDSLQITVKRGSGIVLTGSILESSDSHITIRFTLKNGSSSPILYCADPQQAKGNFGHYVSVDEKNRSLILVESRVFERLRHEYSNDQRVLLKMLQAGESITQTIDLKWPLSETAPPVYLPSAHSTAIIRKDVKHVRLTVGYFLEEAPILEFLSRKPFGWYIKGTEELVPGGQRIYDLQRLVSTDLSLSASRSKQNQDFMGCWTSGNGNAMRIKSGTIQTKNSYKPLKYRAVPDDEIASQRGVYLIELLEADQSNELMRFLTFRMLEKEEMEEKGYDSYEGFKAGQEISTYSRWVNDSCATVRSFLK